MRIAAINFESDGLVIAYADPERDVRVGGRVQIMHQAFLSLEHGDYAEDYDLLQRQALKALRNALEDFENSEPYDPSDEDEVEGMGMGHDD